MSFSVMITTRNRCEVLQRTLNQLQKLQPAPYEILLCADGCKDATVRMVQTDFPQVRMFVHEAGLGSVGSRHRMLVESRGEWVLSLDDDSYPIDLDFLARVPQIIKAHPEAMVITFPELRDGDNFPAANKTPQSPGHYTSAYPNCAALMHRMFYLRQPGFPLHFVHMYEEPDYALQCYAAGMAVWFEPSLTIRHHLTSVERQPRRRHQQNARNELWSVWMRCPWPWVPLVSLFRIWRQFRYAYAEGITWVLCEPQWWWAAVLGAVNCLRRRNPIPWPGYLAWMKLARQPIHNMIDLRRAFGLQSQ